MWKTRQIFEDRKSEVEFYYSVLLEFDSKESNIKTIDNSKFERILKSNFILMLYNLIEACITIGFTELYEMIESDNISYEDVSCEFQAIWTELQIANIQSTNSKKPYVKAIKSIIDNIISKKNISFDFPEDSYSIKTILGLSGNLDARSIKDLLNKHNIRFEDSHEKSFMYQIKIKRNSLAHGEESFADCTRDLTISDFENYKDEVLDFISLVIESMSSYYDNKNYIN